LDSTGNAGKESANTDLGRQR